MVFLAVGGGDVITIDGFSNPDDCAFAGAMNLKHVQLVYLGGEVQKDKPAHVPNPNARFRCAKTGIPPVKCYPDRRSYGRTGECILTEQKASV